MAQKKPTSNSNKKTTSNSNKKSTTSRTRKSTSTTNRKPATKTSRTRKKTSTKKSGPGWGQRFVQGTINLIKDERTPRFLGLLCILFAIYCVIAFVSYIFTGEADQNYMHRTSSDFLFDSELSTKNWLGRLGTFLGHVFIYRGFGIASFLLIIGVFFTGLKLLKPYAPFTLSKVYQYCFLSTLLLSAILGLLFAGFKFPYGGNFGKYINLSLISFIGKIGTILLLFFLLAVILMWVFNIKSIGNWNFGMPEAWETWKQEQAAAAAERERKRKLKKAEKERQLKTASNTKEKTTRTTTPEKVGIEHQENSLDIEKVLASGRQIELDFQAKEKQARKRAKAKRKKEEDPEQQEIILDIIAPYQEKINTEENSVTPNLDTPYDPTLELSDYKPPVLSLLEFYGNELLDDDVISINREELEANKIQIVETLNNYNIEISKIWATPGPTVTLYEIVPAPGVRISKIRNLEDDIALSLAALGIRIIAPMPGKGTIGIEVPNQNPEIVSLRGILASDKFQKTKMDLPIALGKTISNENYVADLAKMPHLLMAGATGQGKSVCLNSILISLLYKKHPSELKFVMVDPKKVELSLYNIIDKHFLAKLPDEEEAIVTDTKKVINTLNALCIEMDMRYDLLKKASVRNLREYNIKFKQRRLNPEKGHRFMPYIVLVIDEFADLIMTAGKEVEMPIARLAQLARAVGLHLVIATQRPTVNIITGTIKANFPCRIAFRVTSKIDSRTILDAGGANQLIGRGDMLLSLGGNMVRLQGAFVDTPEVDKVNDFISQQRGLEDAFLLPEYRDDDGFMQASNGDKFEFDDLFEDAARIVVQHQSGSTSLLQRRLKLGYNRAGRIMDQLEATSIVGPKNGSKAREVYVLDDFELNKVIDQLKNN